MKKFIITIALALLCTFASRAQFGIVGGLTSTSTTLEGAYQELSAMTLNQYHVGITYKFGSGKIFAFQPALIYNVKGARLGQLGSVSDINLKTGYLELPLSLQLGFSLGEVIRIYGIGEPFIGYAITNDASITGFVVEGWDNMKTKFEYGASLGAGVELFKHLEVNLKYFWNFGQLYSADLTLDGLKKTIESSSCSGISLSLAILF